MSLVRKHFWTVVRRGWGGFAWPMKYGLNWTMPALVNSRVGSPGGTRGAPDMRRWPRSSKKRRKDSRISSGFTAVFDSAWRIRGNYSVGGWQARDDGGHDPSLKTGASRRHRH